MMTALAQPVEAVDTAPGATECIVHTPAPAGGLAE